MTTDFAASRSFQLARQTKEIHVKELYSRQGDQSSLLIKFYEMSNTFPDNEPVDITRLFSNT